MERAGPMSGIHHVTAISGKAARNLEFYRRVIGLRFVKKTVNFDDPSSYHLYYGDEVGHPGTILTFFPWEHAAPGRGGVGWTQETAFRIPAGSIGYWTHRLIEQGVPHQPLEHRFDEPFLAFTDPDGLSLALVGVPGAESEPAWSGMGIFRSNMRSEVCRALRSWSREANRLLLPFRRFSASRMRDV